ncbi:ABC-type proline/glycine betaine transport system, periplasmic component [Rubidibacter lacunae KORDI 51-2]|uniref:ABC-type proline/glycine betaine transport system, periplasmic component n=1 Tax=Rubidibacter lacunae KORDI 51-2 TaxID=582515 RepID=U5DRB2_9CHRO|nr:glycine betaine/L-proline ABC transporter substrate-binding protein ProX [Rubidibacter lacunae]ERN43144.1 ABC-type proline/glycine betaine transport system, periplasmic component [Rubidibacter lacunae KORDI 51-2]
MTTKRLLKPIAIAAALLLTGALGCQQPAADEVTGALDGDTTDSPSESATETPGAGTTVTAAYSVLEERFQTEIVNIGLEQLGYEIAEPKEIEYATMHVDIANGGTDFTAAHWQRLHSEFFKNSGDDDKLERVGTIVDNVLQGYAIDKRTVEVYGIANLQDLQNPEIAALFDTDGNGKANLTGCNPGWGCELVIEHHLAEYGLTETVEHDQGQYFALIADTIARYNQGEPVLYYTWTPLWVSGVLPPGEAVEWVEVPYTSLPEAQGDVSKDLTTAEGKNLGFAVDRQMVLSNDKFLAAHPAARRFFEQVAIPIEDISAQNQLMQDGEDGLDDIRRHAEAWITEHQEVFDRWLAAARQVN